MSCSDVKERFVYMSLLLIILIRNMAEFDWQLEQLFELIPVFCTIFFSEFFIDWIKHAFVLKFNNISAEVFNEFKINLSYLLIEAKNKRVRKDIHTFILHFSFVYINRSNMTFRATATALYPFPCFVYCSESVFSRSNSTTQSPILICWLYLLGKHFISISKRAYLH